MLVPILRKIALKLNLEPKAVGNITGVATSVPEFLTVCFSATSGFIGTSIYNILSSNVINLIQYVSSIFLNKNQKVLKNRAIKIDLILVAITIIIPIILFAFNIEINIGVVPIFIGLCVLFVYLNSNVHKLYLKNEDEKLEKEIEEEEKWQKNNKKKTVKYIFYLLCSGVLLFVVGELLGNTLENLCNQFNISQTIIGILLGFITSIPELITFFEAQKHYKKNTEDAILGVVEATNNLFTSNILNLFVIQSIGIIIYSIFA